MKYLGLALRVEHFLQDLSRNISLHYILFFQSSTVLLSPKISCNSESNSILIITKIPLEIFSVKIWKILENSADILCVNFKSKRKGTPFQIKTYLMMTLNEIFLNIRCWFLFLSIIGGQLLVISLETRIIFVDELRFSDLGRPFFDFPR